MLVFGGTYHPIGGFGRKIRNEYSQPCLFPWSPAELPTLRQNFACFGGIPGKYTIVYTLCMSVCISWKYTYKNIHVYIYIYIYNKHDIYIHRYVICI